MAALFLTSTDVLKVVTDAAATVDVHASFVDRSGTTDTPAPQNTAISTATTTTVVSAPSAPAVRNVRSLIIHNKSAATTVTVTVNLVVGGATTYELYEAVLGPNGTIYYDDALGFRTAQSTVSPQARPWFGKLAGCYGDGDPGALMALCQSDGAVAATPTNIGTSVARCLAFMLPADLTFNRIRAYGVGATTTTYRVAIYRMSDLARLTAELAFTTVANTWVSIGSALNVTLTKDTLYFVACSVNATGTTAGCMCMGATTTATTGQVQSTPAALPGSMAQGATNYLNHFQFQFAVTTGALPNPAATLAAAAAWTGGMPAFWLDNADV